MKSDEVIQAFRDTHALLEGHFCYASGRHGKQFLQASRVLQHPEYTEPLCKAIAQHYADAKIDMVVGPATGGIILSYETARHVNCRACFTEKDNHGGFALKRGFHLKPGARILVVEDIVTTAGSVKKSIAHLRLRGAEIVGAAVLIDRSGGEAALDCPFHALATLRMESWAPDHCGLCEQGVPVTEPDNLVI